MGVQRLRLVQGLVIALVAACATTSYAQAPPRFYWKSLTGGQAVPVIGMSMSGNANPIDPAHLVVPGASFEATVAVGGYARSITLFDRAASAAVLLPMGRISGEASIFGQTFNQEASGFGDPTFEVTVNLIGPEPILNIPDLVRYEPGFSLDLLVDLIVPIGEYHSDQPLNIGQNRWYGRVGAPIVWQLGPWIPGRRTTLEFLPALWLFGDNDDFVGRNLSTDPMFQLEGHLTRDFHEDLWGSFDLVWITGGQASINGFKGEEIDNIGLGLTLGYHINDNLQLTAGYMATVNDSDPTDLRMDGFKVSLLFGWHPLIEGMKRLEGE